MARFFLTSTVTKPLLVAVLSVAVVALGLGASVAAMPADSLLRKLAAPASVRWRDVPLGPALQRVGNVTSTPLWIDRRVDPHQRITLTAAYQPLASLLDEVAKRTELGAVAFDRVVYVGPYQTARFLAELSDQPAAAVPRVLRRQGASLWKRLATPREIAMGIAEEVGVQIENPERIPHDVWPSGGTPAMAAGDRLTLVLAGFDLRWQPVGPRSRHLRVEPVDAVGAQSELPTLATMLKAKDQQVAGETRYTLRIVDKPLGAVLRQLADQLGRQVEIDPSLGALEARVSIDVTQAKLEDLLSALAEAGGVRIVNDGMLVVLPLP